MAPSPARIVATHLPAWPPSALGIENAIAEIEDALAPAYRKLGRLGPIGSDDPQVLAVARAAGVAPPATTLDREQVEALFERLAAVALGRPNVLDPLAEDPRLAASIVILRESMHHLDVPSITLLPVREPLAE